VCAGVTISARLPRRSRLDHLDQARAAGVIVASFALQTPRITYAGVWAGTDNGIDPLLN